MARPLKLHLFHTLAMTPQLIVFLMMLLLKLMILSLHGPSTETTSFLYFGNDLTTYRFLYDVANGTRDSEPAWPVL